MKLFGLNRILVFSFLLTITSTGCVSQLYIPETIKSTPKDKLAVLGEFPGSLNGPSLLISVNGISMPRNSDVEIYLQPGMHLVEYLYTEPRKDVDVYREKGEVTRIPGGSLIVTKSGFSIGDALVVRKCRIELRSGKRYSYLDMVKESVDCKNMGY